MLTTTSEYALRALTHLTRLPKGGSMLGRQLAEGAGIPANYLSKILWTLGNAGIIDATRGNHGGYRLKRSAGEIASSRWSNYSIARGSNSPAFSAARIAIASILARPMRHGEVCALLTWTF